MKSAKLYRIEEEDIEVFGSDTFCQFRDPQECHPVFDRDEYVVCKEEKINCAEVHKMIDDGIAYYIAIDYRIMDKIKIILRVEEKEKEINSLKKANENLKRYIWSGENEKLNQFIKEAKETPFLTRLKWLFKGVNYET